MENNNGDRLPESFVTLEVLKHATSYRTEENLDGRWEIDEKENRNRWKAIQFALHTDVKV